MTKFLSCQGTRASQMKCQGQGCLFDFKTLSKFTKQRRWESDNSNMTVKSKSFSTGKKNMLFVTINPYISAIVQNQNFYSFTHISPHNDNPSMHLFNFWVACCFCMRYVNSFKIWSSVSYELRIVEHQSVNGWYLGCFFPNWLNHD